MELHTLRPPAGSKKARKRVGRGPGSGMGKTSARGHKGARARSGYKDKRYFEGGQMPLHRRLPKFGFTNIFKQEFQVVNLADLARCAGTEITSVTLKEAGIIRSVQHSDQGSWQWHGRSSPHRQGGGVLQVGHHQD